MKNMTMDEFKTKIEDGRFFTVSFFKKNGELRVMNCRRGVRANIKDASYRIDPKQRKDEDERNNVLTVYDVHAWDSKKKKRGQFRRINLSTIDSVTLDGETWVWHSEKGYFFLEQD